MASFFQERCRNGKGLMQERMKQMASNYDKQVDIGKSYFLKYDQEKLAVKFHLEMDERYLYLTYIGTPFEICECSKRNA